MIKFAKLSILSIVALLACAMTAMAQTEEGAAPAASNVTAVAPQDSFVITNYLGIGLVVIGASYGIGKLAASALEGMARQPEVAGSIQTAMIIAAALIEGFTFFALILCWFA